MPDIPAPAGFPRRAMARARRSLLQGRTLPEAAWRRRHRVLIVLLALNAVAIPAYALLQGYSLSHGLLDASPIAGFAGMAKLSRGRKLGSILVSLGFLTASAVVVHLSHGVIEAHFY